MFGGGGSGFGRGRRAKPARAGSKGAGGQAGRQAEVDHFMADVPPDDAFPAGEDAAPGPVPEAPAEYSRSSDRYAKRAAARDAPDKPKRPGPSLKMRALGYLSRREHSRAELARKLEPHAESKQVLDDLLDELEQRKHLSDQRFADARAHTLGQRYGSRRLQAELRGRGLSDDIVRSTVDASKEGELERARAVWMRKFGTLPANASERGKQARFLLTRGYSPDIVKQILSSIEE
jgi:regulatory protein